MRTTIDVPDELMTEVKIEAARRRQKLNQLIPELLEAGLGALRGNPAGDHLPKTDMKAWLARMQSIGAEVERLSVDERSVVEIVLQDRR